MSEPMLEVEGLTVDFVVRSGRRRVLTDIRFSVGPGSVVGVVGEAGAGKSVLVRTLLRLLPETAQVTDGGIRFRGRDLLEMAPRELRQLRGRSIAHILADAKSQLNPLIRIGDMLSAVQAVHGHPSKHDRHTRAIELLTKVGITDPERRLTAYPHELSGGMAQRICIALALMHRPELIVADEPTAGLDVTVQRQVLDLMAGLVRDYSAAQVVVTRDLGIVAHYCQEILVMREGRIVEAGPVLTVFDSPSHPYTQHLLEVSGAAAPGRQAV